LKENEMAISKTNPDGATGEITWHPIDEERVNAQQKWIDDTQNMRVVALNEACGIAKAMSDDITAEEITMMAAVFAEFLIENRVSGEAYE
jgi:hypothetical protein